MKVTDENRSEVQSAHSDSDPNPYQNVTDLEHWYVLIENSVFADCFQNYVFPRSPSNVKRSVQEVKSFFNCTVDTN